MVSALLNNESWDDSPPYIRGIVREWYARSQDSEEWTSVFDRFIFLWIAFDAWGTCEFDRWGDRMIDFVRSSPLQQHFKRDRLKIEQSLQDLSKEKIPDYRKDPTGRARISLEDPHDFAKLMEVLYLIRNNLF